MIDKKNKNNAIDDKLFLYLAKLANPEKFIVLFSSQAIKKLLQNSHVLFLKIKSRTKYKTDVSNNLQTGSVNRIKSINQTESYGKKFTQLHLTITSSVESTTEDNMQPSYVVQRRYMAALD